MATPADTALEAQIRKWIKQNRRENSRLEFKQRIELSTIGAKAEFIRDVIALANSEGEAPRNDGYLVIGFRDGKHFDIRDEHYDGATLGQVLDAYVFPNISTSYEEFANGSGGRIGVLIVRPDPNVLYVVRKHLGDGKGSVLLNPGQCWGRRSDRKLELTGDQIGERRSAILKIEIDAATKPLIERITRLESEAGPALEVKKIRFELELTRDWTQIESCLERLLPYAREFDQSIKNEVLDAVHAATAWTRDGMTITGASAIDAVLGEVMPAGFGGMIHPSRKEISPENQSILKRIEDAAFELAWDACRYVRDPAIARIAAGRYRSLIRFVALNKLQRLQALFIENARRCQSMCNEIRNEVTFDEGWKVLEEAINDALDVPDNTKRTKKRK